MDPIVNEIIKATGRIQMSTKFWIKFCWVPTHIGATGNELADQAAREAA